jgi:murein DD-endopeptidase MepM/ murein hydrolase activator NlpD
MVEFDPNDGPSAFELLGLAGPPAVSDSEPVSHVPAQPPHLAAQPLSRRQLRDSEAKSAGRPTPAAAPRRPVVSTAPRKVATRPPKRKRASRFFLSVGAMLFTAALAIGLSVPASAFLPDAAAQTDSSAKTADVAGQTVSVSDVVTAADTTRTDFTVTSYQEMLRARYGNRNYHYTVGIGPVQWPFPYAVPISGGFGERIAPCRGCSTFHSGIDFVPGDGTPIYAVADGFVSLAGMTAYGLGYEVTIEHTINGQHITSAYGHMQVNSSPLKPGDPVKVGDFVGLVGHTGQATGSHLHFEIHVDGVAIDPYPWLVANAAS